MGRPSRQADCHPEQKHYARGMCKSCYGKAVYTPYQRENRHRFPSQSTERHREYQAQWRAEHREEYREQKRRWQEANRERYLEWRRRWRKEHYNPADPDRIRARAAVGNAIAGGRLIRQPCELCGARAEAHHPLGYAPEHYLTIQWLCRPHHQEAHGGIWKPVRRRAA